MNKVVLIGRLTADPELRQTQSGIASCQFTVAVDRRVCKQVFQQGQDDRPRRLSQDRQLY